MPDALSSPGSAAQPRILLLEEYSALAAAITSALRKFAPHHQAQAARTLKEFERLAGTLRPQLFIIDVDPPWPKISGLLTTLRDDHPDARVLVIGATIAKEIKEHRRFSGALQFLDKPFDVPELGAAVQALLGPWEGAEAPRGRGTLKKFNAVDAALLQCASGRSVTLEVKKGAKTGEIVFLNGVPLHAEMARRTGLDALEEIFSWRSPQIREKERCGAAKTERSIPAGWTSAFIEALPPTETAEPIALPEVASPPAGKAPEPEVIPAQAPAPRPGPAPLQPAARTGKKIVVIDDTEMLLIFVEDALLTADPQLQVSTAPSGEGGVAEVNRVGPDLVVLDYSLPDFNGDEVCRRLLENPQTANIPVLLMSGHVAEMSKVASLLDNVVATLEKPFLSEALVEQVQKILTQARRPRAKRKPAGRPVEQRPVVVEPLAPAPPIAPPEPPPVPVSVPPPPRPVPAPPPAPPQPPAPPIAPVPFAPPKVDVPVPQQHPVPDVVSVAPPIQRLPRTGIAPDVSMVSERAGTARAPGIAAPVVSGGASEVHLGLFLEVASMQLTPSLRMGTIRARPSSLTASLHMSSPMRASFPDTGFQLGKIELSRDGRIGTVRVIATAQPFMAPETRNAFQIAGLAIVPENSHELLQLTPSAQAPMRLHLLALFELAGVELTPSFQLSQLVLRPRSNVVRVTLNPQAMEPTGTACEMATVQTDGYGRLAEITLNPRS